MTDPTHSPVHNDAEAANTADAYSAHDMHDARDMSDTGNTHDLTTYTADTRTDERENAGMNALRSNDASDDVQWFTGSDFTHRTAAAIAKYGPIARTKLAQILGLSQGALSRITSDLIYLGVIEELTSNKPDHRSGKSRRADTAGLNEHVNSLDHTAETRDTKRGRPQTALQLRADQRTFIGVNIHDGAITITQVDALCRPISSWFTEELASNEPTAVAAQIAGLIEKCVNHQYAAPTAIGVSLGGHVVDQKTVNYAPFLHWDGSLDFAALVHQACGLPTTVSNDLDALLLYESWFGHAVDEPRFAVLTLGAGIGYSLADHGKAINDPDKSYGLAGHILVDPEGPRCTAGHIGCSQCLTSDSIAEEYSKTLGKVVSFEDFASDLRFGKPLARRLAERTSFRLGVLIANVANMAMPQRVLVSGEASFIVKTGKEAVRQGIAWYRPSQASRVQFDVLDFTWEDWAKAAAACAIARYIG